MKNDINDLSLIYENMLNIEELSAISDNEYQYLMEDLTPEQKNEINRIKNVYAEIQRKYPYRLHCILDKHLGFPKISINSTTGKVIIRDSRNMIDPQTGWDGKQKQPMVKVNGITCTDWKMQVKKGDYIHWGMTSGRYGGLPEQLTVS